jgi:hypothetical protein
VDDSIDVQYEASEKLAKAIEVHRGYIQGEVIAKRMQPSEKPQGVITTEHQFDGESLLVALRKVAG